MVTDDDAGLEAPKAEQTSKFTLWLKVGVGLCFLGTFLRAPEIFPTWLLTPKLAYARWHLAWNSLAWGLALVSWVLFYKTPLPGNYKKWHLHGMLFTFILAILLSRLLWRIEWITRIASDNAFTIQEFLSYTAPPLPLLGIFIFFSWLPFRKTPLPERKNKRMPEGLFAVVAFGFLFYSERAPVRREVELCGKLIDAVDAGNAEESLKLVRAGAPPDGIIPGYALTSAVFLKNRVLIHELLEAGANPNAMVLGTNPLRSAISTNQPAVMDELIRRGASFKQATEKSFSLSIMEEAAASGSPEVLQKVFQYSKNMKPLPYNPKKDGAVAWAALFDRLENIQFLDKKGWPLDVEKQPLWPKHEAKGWSPVWAAAKWGSLRSFRYLVSRGVPLHTRLDRPMLHEIVKESTGGRKNPATLKTRRLIMEDLLKLGFGVNDRNLDGNTPLHVSAKWCTSFSANWLLEHGANRTAQNKKGQMPIQVLGEDAGEKIKNISVEKRFPACAKTARLLRGD